MTSLVTNNANPKGVPATHEDFSRNPGMKLSSDRTFGLVWTVFLILYGLAPLRHARGIRVLPLAIAGVLLPVAVCYSKVLRGPNIWWGKIGLLLNRIVNPIVMGLMFYICFVPVGLLNRMRKKDPLHLKLDPSAGTYWIERESSVSNPSSMTHQY